MTIVCKTHGGFPPGQMCNQGCIFVDLPSEEERLRKALIEITERSKCSIALEIAHDALSRGRGYDV